MEGYALRLKQLLLPGLLLGAIGSGAIASGPTYSYVPGQIVLDFENDLPNQVCAEKARGWGFESPTMPDPTSDDENFVLARVPKGKSPLEWARSLKDRPGLESASPNWILKALYTPDDPRFKEQWHMVQIGADQAWDVTRGKGVVVAVIDTGVTFELDKNNPRVKLLEDLDSKRGWVPGYDFVNTRECAVDDHAHGNHVAGTIAQKTNNGVGVAGIAYEAKIMPIKVLSAQGGGTMLQVASGIHFAAKKGVDVINMSLGGGPREPMMEEAVQAAKDAGAIVICAAGNENLPYVSYPAAYPGAVAISAVNSVKQRSFYSNWGDEIALAAPGGDRTDHNGDGIEDGVLQNTVEPGNPAKPGYYSFIGTSMASPHAAGVAALVKSLGVTDPDACLEVMQQTAEKLDQPEDENLYGAGLIQARAAVDKIAFWFSIQKLFMALLFLLLAKKLVPVRTGATWCPTHVAGLLFGSAGLFFLPYLGVSNFPLQDLLCKGLPEWDLYFFGASGHGNILFYSALFPWALVLVGFRSPRLARAWIAGVSLGLAGHFAWYALFPVANLSMIPDLFAHFGDQVWLASQALLSFLAALAMRLGEER